MSLAARKHFVKMSGRMYMILGCLIALIALGVCIGCGGGGGGGGGGGESDDHADSPAGASSILTNGSSLAGVIEVPGDVDYFKFVATLDKTYSIYTDGSMDTLLFLYDSNGTTIIEEDDDGGPQYLSWIDWTCPTSGTYYVKVQLYHEDRTGSYTLAVEDQGCTVTNTCSTKSCYNGDVWCYNNCGDREYMDDDCGSNGCSGGTCQGGGTQSVTLYATGDTYVSNGTSTFDDNFGGSQGLYTGQVNFGGPPGEPRSFWAFVKFDISSIPAGAQIIRGTLYLVAGRNSVPCGTQTAEASVTVAEVLTSWTEYGLTYINMPALYKYIYTKTVTDFNDCISHEHDWDVTAAVTDWVSGTEANNGLSITSRNIVDVWGTNQDFCTIYSKEVSAGAGPRLVVEYSE